uniref:Uncharacterized protein n=1 Tax=Anopheles albimanus TaxID=7167 RepID=A0A182F5C0_ANOAL
MEQQQQHSHVNGKSARHSAGSTVGANGREYWGKLPEPSAGGGSNSQHSSQPPSPTSSRKDKSGSSPSQSRRSTPSSKGTSSGRSKAAGGVPQSFGYIKRTNGSSSIPGVDQQQQQHQQQLVQQQQQQQQQGQNLLTGGRTAHVSAVPRSGKLKVSGGTQTTTADFQASKCRSSRGDHLDSVGTNPPAMEQQQQHSHVNGKSARHSAGSTVGANGREYWGKLPEPSAGGGSNSQHSSQPPSPTSSRKDKSGSSPSQSRRSTPSSKGTSSGRSKAAGGVPQSFGYIKRTNGSSSIPGVDQQQQQHQQQLVQQQQQQQQQGQNLHTGGRTAHVSAVPRSGKLKVSGGTQTTTADFQAKVQQHPQYRSFSLTGPGAAQLSQSVKERFGSGTHSLPKPGLDMHVFQHRMSNRASAKLTDGSLSDTQTYAEVKPDYGSYAMWLKHSSTASSRLSEGDTLDAIAIGSSPAAAVAAVTGTPGSATRPHKLLHHARGETQQPHHSQHHHHHTTGHTSNNSPRLNRSNSIRSTKSEKMYPSMLSRGPDVEIEPYYCLPVGTVVHSGNGMVPWSQPTSPTPPARSFAGLLSPTHTGSAVNAGTRLTYPKKNDEVHGSQASLLSGGSSLYGSTEERQASEVRRLKRELTDARDQVMSLSSQLST